MIHLKTLHEINQIEKVNKIGAELLAILYDYIKPGITTIELEEIAEKFCRDNKVRPSFKGYRGFPYCLCVSLNEQVVHGFPGERIIKNGDIVSVDFGAEKDGYYSDAAFTKVIKKTSKRIEELVKTTEKALYAGIEKAVVGGRLYDISLAIYSTAKDVGFDVVRQYGGHGVGFEVHEKPFLPNYVTNGINYKLKVGLVIAIEPMLLEEKNEVERLSDGWTIVTKDRKMVAHFEHSIAILSSGPKVLSKI